MDRVILSGSFDDLRSRHVRFLQEAARLGAVHVLLWSDQAVYAMEGRGPKFPQAEREYFVRAIRYVDRLTLTDDPLDQDALPADLASAPATWVADSPPNSHPGKIALAARGVDPRVIEESQLQGFPEHTSNGSPAAAPDAKKVIVTGCYDWFHSGHVRFFEEVAQIGRLYVAVGHDDNIKLLKGEGHPMHPQDERRYMAGSIRHVQQALITTGHGWLDAEPEIEQISPDVYVVNEDGDQPAKRKYCQAHGIEYRILKRTPKAGLTKRQSTVLRGF